MTKQILVAAVAASALAAVANADLVAGWTIATAVPAATTGVAYNYGAADQGAGAAGSMLSSSHAVAAATYSSPTGNGSQYALSSNNWTMGDYYQISFDATGSDGLSVSWDQTRSSTGPSTFDALMSIDGGTSWTTILAAYSVIQAGLAGTGTTSWNSTTYQAAFTTTISLGAAANNQASVLVRFASTVTTAAAGTNRIDNIMVNNSVPTPGAVVLLGMAGLIARRRR